MDTTSETPLDHALRCAAHGWLIFPVAGKKPRDTGWQQQATTDPETIRRWFHDAPGIHYGIRTGPGSDLLVVDIDPGAPDTLDGYAFPATRTHTTPRGGRHLLYRYAGSDLKNSASKLTAHIDIRGRGGLIVGPGTEGRTADDTPVAELPDELRRRILAKQKGKPYTRPASSIAEGERTTHALSVGGLAKATGASDEAIEQLLAEANAQYHPPLPDAELQTIIDGVRRFEAAPVENVAEFSDLNNGRRFAALYAHEIRWCPQLNQWLVYASGRWQHHGDLGVRRRAEHVAIALMLDVVRRLRDEPDQERRKTLQRRLGDVVKLQQRRSLENTCELAKGPLQANLTAFDGDLMLVNFLNGTYDRRTRTLRPHDPKDLLRHQIPHDLAEHGTPTPGFDRLLLTNSLPHGQAEPTARDLALRDFRLAVYGSATVARWRDKTFNVLLGERDSGKTTEMELLKALLGPDYSTTVPAALLLHRRDIENANAPTAALMALNGPSLISLSEAKPGDVFDDGVLKSVTGGNQLSGRYPYAREMVTFHVRGKFFLDTNNVPEIRSDDQAALNRVLVIPFRAKWPEHDPSRIPDLTAHLVRTEGPAILRKLIEAGDQWLAAGLPRSVLVEEASQRYRLEQDTLSDFLHEMVEEMPASRIHAPSLYRCYHAWSIEQGFRFPLKARQFRKRLIDRGWPEPVRSNGMDYWTGFALRGPKV
jgi:putative DNA primase/helicase